MTAGIRRAVDKVAWAKKLEQDNYERTTATEQPNKTTWTGQLGYESQDTTAREDVEIEQQFRTRLPEHDNKERTAGAGQ
jgi:hypothetical protein